MLIIDTTAGRHAPPGVRVVRQVVVQGRLRVVQVDVRHVRLVVARALLPILFFFTGNWEVKLSASLLLVFMPQQANAICIENW